MMTELKIVQMAKTCKVCGVSKPLSDFHKNEKSLYGVKNRCKPCQNKIGRQRDYPNHKRSGIKNRPDKLMKLYGVTYEQVEKVLIQQSGLCANPGCKCEVSLMVQSGAKHRAVIDHCHKTGKFRAILCTSCNLELGKVEANKTKILGLFEYLNNFDNLKKE